MCIEETTRTDAHTRVAIERSGQSVQVCVLWIRLDCLQSINVTIVEKNIVKASVSSFLHVRTFKNDYSQIDTRENS